MIKTMCDHLFVSTGLWARGYETDMVDGTWLLYFFSFWFHSCMQVAECRCQLNV